MNYILQLTGFFNRIANDKRLIPSHVSLYVAIFRQANAERFKQPFYVSRSELMSLSKIKGRATYHRCMKDLQEFGYIIYEPSFHPHLGSLVSLVDLQGVLPSRVLPKELKRRIASSSIMSQVEEETSSILSQVEGVTSSDMSQVHEGSSSIMSQVEGVTSSIMEPYLTNYESGSIPYIKNKHINNIESKHTHTHEDIQELVFSIPKSVSKNPHLEAKILSQIKKIDAHFSLALEEKTFPPTLEMLSKFFVEQNSTFVEAQKFFNHYQSNGWRVGGKAPMVDWKAAASNWLLNAPRFSPPPIVAVPVPPTPGVLNTSTLKDYSEPL